MVLTTYFRRFLGILLQIKFLASLRTLIGKDELALHINSKKITVRDLIFELNKKLGQNFGDLIVNKDLIEINPEILIFVNNKEIQTLQKLETILTDGNYIVFVSAIHGGFNENKINFY